MSDFLFTRPSRAMLFLTRFFAGVSYLFLFPNACPTTAQDAASRMEAQLKAATAKLEADPHNLHNWIWVGRRQAYLGLYEQSVKTFSQGLERFPTDARFLRHRGHRWITLRKFDKAIEDLELAARLIAGTEDQIEPDGQPNKTGVPTSTLHSNIWYHLGLTHFLTGNFEDALVAYERCLGASTNDDMRVATLDWLYMTLCRLDRRDQAEALIAKITPEMKISENHAYHRRLLMYRGILKPTDLLPSSKDRDGDKMSESANDAQRDIDLATNGFGVGHWYLLQGDKRRAGEIFEEVVRGKSHAAFGFIAAEVELHRMKDDAP